jgi:hypothetical protein
MGGSGDMVMNRLVLLPLVLPFACLALLSFVAFVGVGAIAGALHVIRMVMTGDEMKTRGTARSETRTRSNTLRRGTSGDGSRYASGQPSPPSVNGADCLCLEPLAV